MRMNIEQRIKELLNKLKNVNDADETEGLLNQRIEKSDKMFSKVPTLLAKRTRPISPMLRARFIFAGRWSNAAGSQTWLSLRDMREACNDQAVMGQVARRRKYWPNAVIANRSLDDLSLFGMDNEEDEECYLLWSANVEPSIAVYIGHEEKCFENLETYLEFLVG